MAAERTHTPFGFDCGLDWRPTVFVDGMPANRVCHACGLVPSTVAVLSCRHVLCQPCYDRTTANDGRCCLDGDAIQSDDVLWSTVTTESLLRRKIQCWNAPGGCSASGPARGILNHFSKECAFHAVTCPRCDRSVAHTNVVDHIASGSCTRSATHEHPTRRCADPEVKRITSVLGGLEEKVSLLQISLEGNLKHISDRMQKAAETPHPDLHLLESNQCLENTVRESTQLSRRGFVEMGEAHAALRDKLEEIGTSLQNISELVREIRASQSRRLMEKESAVMAACADVKREIEALRAASSVERQKDEENSSLLEKIMEEMKENAASEDSFREEVGAKLAVLEAVSNSPFHKKINGSEPLEWSIESVSELKKEVSDKNFFTKSPEYFYGYHILPGVRLKTRGNIQSLSLVFKICKGVHDQILTWPIKKRLCLKFLHPTDSGKNELIAVNSAHEDLEQYEMPSTKENKTVNSLAKVELGKLQENGYVKNNKIFVRFEVL